LSPSKLNWSPTNLALGFVSALKKSLLFRCLSSCATPVLTEPVSNVTSALPDLPWRSIATEPSFLSKRPRSVEVLKCLASKVTKVCVGSIA
jgi:hypothetical protein